MTAPAVLVFARAPLAGESKTRLVPALGAAGAAALHARLLARTLEEVGKVPGVRPVLCADSDRSLAWFSRHALPPGWDLVLQRGEDLGSRMRNALADILPRAHRALLIGSDIIDFAADDLVQALRALDEDNELVLGPAADGGYWLIGAKEVLPPALFDGVPWGTGHVLADTCQRCEDLHLRWQSVAMRHDIDVPADLRVHRRALTGLRTPAWQAEVLEDLSPMP